MKCLTCCFHLFLVGCLGLVFRLGLVFLFFFQMRWFVCSRFLWFGPLLVLGVACFFFFVFLGQCC